MANIAPPVVTYPVFNRTITLGILSLDPDDIFISLVNNSALVGVTQSLFVARAMADGVLTTVDIWIGSLASAGTAKFDININGVSIFSDPNDRPSITSGDTVSVTVSEIVQLGDKLSIDVDEVPLGGIVGSFDCRFVISPA